MEEGGRPAMASGKPAVAMTSAQPRTMGISACAASLRSTPNRSDQIWLSAASCPCSTPPMVTTVAWYSALSSERSDSGRPPSDSASSSR